MNTAIVGLGSNIHPEKNIERAIGLISQDHHVLKRSRFVKTKPVGYQTPSDFINGSILLETTLDYETLRKKLKKIEALLGRERKSQKFSDRTIDLDIVVWNSKIMDQDFYTRDFVKKSVLELMPKLKG